MLMQRRPSTMRGFSLVEFIVAGAIGLFILSGTLFIFLEIVKTSNHALKNAHLRQTLMTVMSVMSGELRRAGYWSRAELTLGGEMTNGFAPIHLSGANCILYSYDQEKNNASGTPGAGDQLGLRLSGGSLQIKTSDPHCGAATCTGCDSGNWWALTDPRTITVTALTFDETQHKRSLSDGQNAVVVREIHIGLTGVFRGDPAIRHTMGTTVNVRNDEIR